MKVYKKNKLNYKNGRLVTKKGKVVTVDDRIIMLANSLETRVQKARWDKDHTISAPKHGKFERESEYKRMKFEAETPMLDRKIAESMALMNDIEANQKEQEINTFIDSLHPLIEFMREDEVLCSTDITSAKFDTPTLGNPLEWDEDTIIEAVGVIFDVDVDQAKHDASPIIMEFLHSIFNSDDEPEDAKENESNKDDE